MLTACSPFYRKKVLDVRRTSSDEIRMRVEKNLWQLEGFKGRARVSFEMPGHAFSAFSNVTLKMPDSLLLKMEMALGINIGFFFADRNSFAIYTPFQNTLYSGTIKDLNFSQFLQLDLGYDDLLEVFTGIPLIANTDSTSLTIDHDQYLVICKDQKGTRKYWVDPYKYVVKKSQLLDSRGRVILTKEFSRFRKEKGVTLPKIIRVSLPQENKRLTIFYVNRRTNSKLQKKDFDLSVPSNTQKIHL